MIRKKIRAPILLIGWLIALAATACAAPTPIPMPTPAPTPIDPQSVDLKPFLRDLLATLPANEHLLTSQDLAQMKPVIVDVRQPAEYAQGFIAGAVNIPVRELAASLTTLPGMDKDIVVVCDTGHRSAIGMAVLQMLGYGKAKTLQGGMHAWRAAQQTIVTAPVPPKPNHPAPKVNAHIQAALDYYLAHTLPYDWGIVNTTALTADQKLLPSSAVDAMPETYDQGPSWIVNVDTPDEYAKSTVANFRGVFNFPLRQLLDRVSEMPAQSTVDFG